MVGDWGWRVGVAARGEVENLLQRVGRNCGEIEIGGDGEFGSHKQDDDDS